MTVRGLGQTWGGIGRKGSVTVCYCFPPCCHLQMYSSHPHVTGDSELKVKRSGELNQGCLSHLVAPLWHRFPRQSQRENKRERTRVGGFYEPGWNQDVLPLVTSHLFRIQSHDYLSKRSCKMQSSCMPWRTRKGVWWRASQSLPCLENGFLWSILLFSFKPLVSTLWTASNGILYIKVASSLYNPIKLRDIIILLMR